MELKNLFCHCDSVMSQSWYGFGNISEMALKISPKMPRRAESSAFGCHYVLKIENIKNTRIRSLDNLDL